MRNRSGVLLIGILLMLSNSAEAEEERRTQVSLSVGALEVVAFSGGHEGLYASVGGGLVIPIGPYASIIPGIGIEWAPENGRWGLLGSVTFDQPLAEWIGVDAQIIIGEDHTALKLEDAILFVGVGFGTSFYLDHVVISPSMNWFPGPGGGALVPALFGSYAF